MSKHKNHSITPWMGHWVEKFDEHCDKEKYPWSMKAFWERHEIFEQHDILLSTFRKYATPNKSKRRCIGGHAGRPPLHAKGKSNIETRAVSPLDEAVAKQTLNEDDQLEKKKGKQDTEMLGHYYQCLTTAPSTPAALKERHHQLKEKERSRLQRQYQHMELDFTNKKRSPALKKYVYEYRKSILPQICAMLGGDDNFLKKELEWVDTCHRTFGGSEVPYKYPSSKEEGDAGGDETQRRWDWMHRRVEQFKLTQTRHALAMLQSRVNRPTLNVAIDTLLRKYDEGLQGRGLEPSNLRWQLRESNYNAIEEMEKRREESQESNGEGNNKKTEEDKEGEVPVIGDLGLTWDRVGDACRRIRSEISDESSRLDAADHAELFKLQIWEVAGRLGKHEHSDLRQEILATTELAMGAGEDLAPNQNVLG